MYWCCVDRLVSWYTKLVTPTVQVLKTNSETTLGPRQGDPVCGPTVEGPKGSDTREEESEDFKSDGVACSSSLCALQCDSIGFHSGPSTQATARARARTGARARAKPRREGSRAADAEKVLLRSTDCELCKFRPVDDDAGRGTVRCG